MQAEVTRLMSYFDGIHTVIEHICRRQCESFIDTVTDGMAQSNSEQQAIATSLSELQAQVSTTTSPLHSTWTRAILIR